MRYGKDWNSRGVSKFIVLLLQSAESMSIGIATCGLFGKPSTTTGRSSPG
jgi:hypothetical protein